MEISKPNRVHYTYRQNLTAPRDRVFPLLCPVRELEWVEGWNPKVVFSESGVAEADCIFITPDNDRDAVWVITEYRPEDYEIGFVKVIPGMTVVQISIQLLPGDSADQTLADISYMFTAISDSGKKEVDKFTKDVWQEFMLNWEKSLNAFLLKRSKSE